LSTAVFSLMTMARSLRGAERLSEDLVTAQRKRGITRRVPDSTLTVWKLDLPEPLRRFFATTNAIENVLGVVRRVSRNVKNWRHGAMAKRWTGIGLIAAEKNFHRIKGHRHMPALVEALSRQAAKGVDQEEAAG